MEDTEKVADDLSERLNQEKKQLTGCMASPLPDGKVYVIFYGINNETNEAFKLDGFLVPDMELLNETIVKLQKRGAMKEIGKLDAGKSKGRYLGFGNWEDK